jgi:hypothetical protein
VPAAQDINHTLGVSALSAHRRAAAAAAAAALVESCPPVEGGRVRRRGPLAPGLAAALASLHPVGVGRVRGTPQGHLPVLEEGKGRLLGVHLTQATNKGNGSVRSVARRTPTNEASSGVSMSGPFPNRMFPPLTLVLPRKHVCASST